MTARRTPAIIGVRDLPAGRPGFRVLKQAAASRWANAVAEALGEPIPALLT
ncbi:hypothetical protein LQ327_09790 [Actinomycetospora endophytica]|uniref:Uncharacterized protein n=1 Tax=Actinomycetospora endophytica TaxID=2291215 RepID=A0ABS8P611_9PSEU|nr:hypothetical protein [Actinomycetospora endophytica]MCD2193671.1 hypothetical protein [Actinomycetospora endophytica]